MDVEAEAIVIFSTGAIEWLSCKILQDSDKNGFLTNSFITVVLAESCYE